MAVGFVTACYVFRLPIIARFTTLAYVLKRLEDEIADAERKPQHETIALHLRVLRSLYVYVLRAMRDGDYRNPSDYVSDLIRQDKRFKKSEHNLKS